jgi:hypothetical protein
MHDRTSLTVFAAFALMATLLIIAFVSLNLLK